MTMMPIMDPNDITKFAKLEGMEVATATSCDVFVANVKRNVQKSFKKVSDLKDFGVVKPNYQPIALVGGGPSIKSELDNLRKFQASGFPVLACGSSHDYLVSQGIVPDYCVLCDPDPITAAYTKRHNEDTKYLVALSCDELVFEVLKDRQVYVWNCKSDDAAEQVNPYIGGHIDIIGGCTVGLRSIPIAMSLGYTNVHFWGFDSCMGSGDAHHAYEFETDKEEVGVVYPVRFGDVKDNKPEEGGKYYMCSGYQLAQAVHFQAFLQQFGMAFTPTFHGEGMLGDFYSYLMQKATAYCKNVVTVSQSAVSQPTEEVKVQNGL